MNYLITGGAGFIGSHLSELLLREQHRVTIIDDLSTGSAANVAHLRANPNFTCTFASIFDRSLTTQLVGKANIIIHLAAAVGVKLVVQSPVHTIETNILGSELILKLAANEGKKVMLASTSEIYGKSSKVPFCEDDDMVFGPSYGDGTQRRCFSYLSDIVTAIYRLSQEAGAVGEIFNLGSDRETSINELAELVRAATSSRSKIVYLPYSEVYGEGFEDMQRRIPSLEKAARMIGYRSTLEIQEIVEKVVSYMSRTPEASESLFMGPLDATFPPSLSGPAIVSDF